MNLFKRTIIVSALLLLFAAQGLFAQMMLQPVAVVNLIRPEMISQEAVNTKMQELKGSSSNPQSITFDTVLNIMINDVLVLQGAERDGVTLSSNDLNALVENQKKSISNQLGRTITDAEFSSILNQLYDLDIDGLKERLFQSYIVNTYVKKAKPQLVNSAVPPTESEIKDFYKKNAASFINPEYVHLSHIYVPKNDPSVPSPKTTLEDARRKISFGTATFDTLIIQYSKDEKTKFLGGDIGWIAIDDTAKKTLLGESFFDSVFSLDKGAISQVIESNTGFHIVKVLDHTYPKILTLEDRLEPDNVMTVRQYIQQSLYVENQTKAYKNAVAELVKDLRGQAEITILQQ